MTPFGAGGFRQLGVVEALEFEVDGRPVDFNVALVEDEVAVGDVYREFRLFGVFYAFFAAFAIGQREALHHVVVLQPRGREVFEEDFAFAFEADLVGRDEEQFVLAGGDPGQAQREVFLHLGNCSWDKSLLPTTLSV